MNDTVLKIEPRAQDPDDSNTFQNIRIHVDTSQLESDWATSEPDLLEYFIDDIIPSAFEWIENAIQVRPGTTNKNIFTAINMKYDTYIMCSWW